jgi:hypothetical protein
MFQAVPPPIIRSSKLYTQHRVFVELFLLLTAIVGGLEPTHDSGKKQQSNKQTSVVYVKACLFLLAEACQGVGNNSPWVEGS